MQARGTSQDDEFLAFQAMFADAVRQRAGITDGQVDAEYGNNPEARGPLNLAWVQAILRAIDKNSPGLNQKSLETFTRDVFLYTTRAGVRDEIDRIVAAKLTDEPTVVIGHSLGTVVAYSVLCTRSPRAEGAPLRHRRLAARGPRDPRPVPAPALAGARSAPGTTRSTHATSWRSTRWTANNFPVLPAIENYNRVNNSTDNHHGIVGYLDDRDVAKRVVNALGG